MNEAYQKYFITLLFCFFFSSSFGQEKVAVFIIGMGRSGTSCTAGILNILGLEMGEPLAPPCDFNKKGKFEHIPTIEFNKPILKALNAIWYKPQLLDWDAIPKKNSLKNKVKEHLARHFGAYSFYGIKNPELTTLLPLYLQAAKELGYTPKIIMVLRHPDETHASLQKFLETPKKDYYRNICLAYACAFKNAQGFDLHVVYFDDLIQNTQKTIAALHEFLPQLKEYQEAEQEITQFIDDGLKHHNAQPTSTSTNH